MYLLDVNVWIAVTFDDHAHNLPASSWFAGVDDKSCYFCRLTQQGFLRLATNPKVLGEDAVTLTAAWALFDELLSEVRVAYCEEPQGLESIWREYTDRKTVSTKLWTDAYLAAFARAADLEIVTFDKGFRQFANLKCTILS